MVDVVLIIKTKPTFDKGLTSNWTEEKLKLDTYLRLNGYQKKNSRGLDKERNHEGKPPQVHYTITKRIIRENQNRTPLRCMLSKVNPKSKTDRNNGINECTDL